jgi:hypothetical protein
MEYKEDQFCITVSENTIIFSGELERIDYSDISNFLKRAEAAISHETVCIDITGLQHLNSTGVRMLAVFLMGSAQKIEIHMNPAITWQHNTIPALCSVKPGGITLVTETV